jgi:hypothetical protein
VASAKVYAKSDFIELSGGDEPVSNPENDKFNLANRLPDEEVNIAMEEVGMVVKLRKSNGKGIL